jgi:hypothetical protein
MEPASMNIYSYTTAQHSQAIVKTHEGRKRTHRAVAEERIVRNNTTVDSKGEV